MPTEPGHLSLSSHRDVPTAMNKPMKPQRTLRKVGISVALQGTCRSLPFHKSRRLKMVELGTEMPENEFVQI